ncbi:Syntaxin 16 [Paratrimastix pyriformis]|uniref:Syntaxin 16 n=1 Tax=Paratrimastix pyriformis TaxID=342808 RepID=A0ABQ8UCJ2_9EUKA|nr:Syntaxin 16 [Paratrimastix pyriformis]
MSHTTVAQISADDIQCAMVEIGGFDVEEVDGEKWIALLEKLNLSKHQLSALKKRVNDILENSDGEYVVEAIRGKRCSKSGQVQYLLKWLGYGERENTWEDAASLENCQKLVREYEDALKASKRRGSQGTSTATATAAESKEKPSQSKGPAAAAAAPAPPEVKKEKEKERGGKDRDKDRQEAAGRKHARGASGGSESVAGGSKKPRAETEADLKAALAALHRERYSFCEDDVVSLINVKQSATGYQLTVQWRDKARNPCAIPAATLREVCPRKPQSPLFTPLTLASRNFTEAVSPFLDLTQNYFAMRQRRQQQKGPLTSGAAETEMSEMKGERKLLDSPKAPMGDSIRPEWMELGTSVKDMMAMVEQKLEQLGKSYRDQRLVSFDDHTTGSSDSIEILSQEISRLISLAQKKLDRIPSETDTKQNQIIRKNLQQQLAVQLSQVTQAFREQQKRYLLELKSSEERAASLSGDVGGGLRQRGPSAPALEDDGSPPEGVYTRGFSDSQKQAVAYNQDMINERLQEIKKIQKSMQNLAQIFRELHMLVVDQGTLLDRIDFNLEQTEQYTEEAVQEQRKVAPARPPSATFQPRLPPCVPAGLLARLGVSPAAPLLRS